MIKDNYNVFQRTVRNPHILALFIPNSVACIFLSQDIIINALTSGLEKQLLASAVYIHIKSQTSVIKTMAS